MKRDFDKPVDQIFFAPGRDAGLYVLIAPGWMWRTAPRGRIAGASISAYPTFQEQIDSHIETNRTRRSFKSAIEFNTLNVICQSVGFVGSVMSVRDKWLLTGASGTRLRNKFYLANMVARPDFDEQLAEHFKTLQDYDVPALPEAAEIPKQLDLVLECRNFFNFYHFVTETLPQLCSVADVPQIRNIRIHANTKEVKGFIKTWVATLFPELDGRVKFVRSPAHYDSALSVLNTRHLYAQCGDTLMPSLDDLAPKGMHWAGRAPVRISQGVLAMNSFDTNLARLRARALRLIEGMDTDHLPKRFWVARDASGPRVREMAGEAELVAELAKRGFETVYFERLTPLEQIAIMFNAEVMMSYHGAGFTNLLFAGPDTHCIEIGTLQTALFRWQDFMPHAHVSGCRYTCLFADFNKDDPHIAPPLRSNALVPVAISPMGITRTLDLVDAIVGTPDTRLPADRVMETAQILAQTEDWAALLRLMVNHASVLAPSVETQITIANALEGLGRLEAAFGALQAAWDLDQTRPFVLERLALMAARLGEGAPRFRLRNLHAQLFPDRHEAFLKRFRRALKPPASHND